MGEAGAERSSSLFGIHTFDDGFFTSFSNTCHTKVIVSVSVGFFARSYQKQVYIITFSIARCHILGDVSCDM